LEKRQKKLRVWSIGVDWINLVKIFCMRHMSGNGIWDEMVWQVLGMTAN